MMPLHTGAARPRTNPHHPETQRGKKSQHKKQLGYTTKPGYWLRWVISEVTADLKTTSLQE